MEYISDVTLNSPFLPPLFYFFKTSQVDLIYVRADS